MSAPPWDVAVIILNHNTAALLGTCLQSLADGGLSGVRATVWVVDNASHDGSADLVRERFPDIQLIASDANVGYAAGNNLALRGIGFGPASTPATVGTPATASPSLTTARARHALLLNPDTVVPGGAIARLVSYLEEDRSIGVVGPKLVRPDGSLDLACRRSFPTPEVSFYRFSGLSRLLPGSRRFGRYNVTYLDPDTPADVDAVVGACMLVRGEAIAAVGLLDERFWMYGEDLDWALRIRQTGWRVVYRPQVVIQHVKRAASAGSDRARYEFLRSMWLFYDKHYARTTRPPVHWLVMAALALRGGPALRQEMRTARRAS